jgi:hypothetical protein
MKTWRVVDHFLDCWESEFWAPDQSFKTTAWFAEWFCVNRSVSYVTCVAQTHPLAVKINLLLLVNWLLWRLFSPINKKCHAPLANSRVVTSLVAGHSDQEIGRAVCGWSWYVLRPFNQSSIHAEVLIIHRVDWIRNQAAMVSRIEVGRQVSPLSGPCSVRMTSWRPRRNLSGSCRHSNDQPSSIKWPGTISKSVRSIFVWSIAGRLAGT